ncbi:1502_t:CDS:2 [Funneliformis mosseae]|uniref:Peptidyl-prolyl isomerase CWC27 n=1 Tax=Funneliformis mosseae TaxID=27381 RepID=A0A9N9F0R8_FUNMO|nr:1502_t:CDS:2 [Funneliformis mosseae]
MSNIYIQEPHTSGKIILHTTSGDISIELFSKEAPKACRNFVQLSLESYFDNTIFHRIVPGFIIQGGDPTGSGHGGESIYGGPFVDEFHTRLRFVRRGLVAMANAGRNDNRSQFFITLDRTDELQNKHTIFGKVVGDTIFNVLKIGELEIDENERPLYPPKIISTEVVWNPFDDIIPRITAAEKLAQVETSATAMLPKEPKKNKLKKNVALLSFGDEAGEFENDQNLKIKSSHDLVEDDPRLSKEVSVKEEALRQEIEQVKQDIRKLNRPRESEENERAKKKARKSFIQLERQRYLTSGKAVAAKRKKGKEVDTLEKLKAFRAKIEVAVPSETETPVKTDEDAVLCILHSVPNCLSCRDTFGEPQQDETDEGWLAHRLVFEKDHKGKDLMQRRDDPNDFIVIDPLARKKQAVEEEREKNAQKGGISEVFIKDRRRERERHSDHHKDSHHNSNRDQDRSRYRSKDSKDYDREKYLDRERDRDRRDRRRY